MVNVGDPAGHGILDRHHRQIGRSIVDGLEHILETGARYGFHLRVDGPAGHVRIGTGQALKCDLSAHVDGSVS